MNVIFDLGGVVFSWQPYQIIKSVFHDTQTQEIVKSEIFDHPDWLALDKGILERDEAIGHAAVRTKLPRTKIIELWQQIPLSLTLYGGTVSLVQTVKRNGNQVFVLSNIHLASIEYLEQKYSFWDIFDGIVISCRIQMVKPDAEIYEYILDKYGLIASETIFIDDKEENLTAASKLGIIPIQFENPNQCESELKKIGCI